MPTKKKAKVKARHGARTGPPETAPSMRIRLALMRQVSRLIEQKEWLQVEAAERCGVSQPRINDLLRGKVSRFSLDALVNIAGALGRNVTFTIG